MNYLLVPVIGAFIGWVTNYIAVKMLFHPRRVWRFLFIPIQGVIPKRQQALAEKLGQVVSRELLSQDDIRSVVQQAARHPQLRALLNVHVDRVLQSELPKAIPLVSMVLSPQLVATAKEVFLKDFDQLANQIVECIFTVSEGRLDVQRLIEQRVSAFSTEKLELIVNEIMRREFKFIELVGAFLGALIGGVQVVLTERIL